jgi:hypothetical protein
MCVCVWGGGAADLKPKTKHQLVDSL